MLYGQLNAAPLTGNENRIRKILIGCRKQHRGSQKMLYEEFYAYGMSICLRYADNRDEAAAILNDGFMKIFNSIRQFNLAKPLKPWLRRIMINTAINHYRKKEHEIRSEEMEKAGMEGEADSVISGITYQEIIGMLQKLPPSYRTVFNLYVIEGYKHEEIAKMLGITPGASKSNLFKAKESLRKILTDFFETDYVEKK